jgi:CubicO group peptidase (beta-lactamase class C family)
MFNYKNTINMRINHLFMAVAASLMLSMPSCAPTMEERANEAIKNVMNEFEVVGISAAVVKNGQIVYNESFGYANLEDKTPLTNEHVMRIASISKSFTATSLLQLVERGIISLDDDVSDLIGFQIRNPYHPEVPITLRMILSHTASIRDPEDYSTLDHLNPTVNGDCADLFFDYQPGKGYNYSNLGLNLAGAILENMSGVRFDKYVKDSVINRLCLHGGHNVDELDTTKIASIYRRIDGEYKKSNAYSSVAHRLDNYTMGYSAPIFSPTGGVKISAHDLATYMMMHMNYGELHGVRIISEESAKTMQTPVWIKQTDDYYEDQYGLCLMEFVDFLDDPRYNTPGKYPVGHTGDAYGLRSIMIWSPADAWGIVAMTNGYTHKEGQEFIQVLANAIYNAAIREEK